MLNIIYRAKYWRRANLLWDSISQQEAITTSSFIIKPIKWPPSLFEVELVKEWVPKIRSSFSQILHLSPVLEQKSLNLFHILQQKLTKESLLAKYHQDLWEICICKCKHLFLTFRNSFFQQIYFEVKWTLLFCDASTATAAAPKGTLNQKLRN